MRKLLPLMLLATTALLPVPKNGASCPTGYYSTGGYCAPTSSGSHQTIPKQGASCPSGWTTSGGSYCVNNAR